MGAPLDVLVKHFRNSEHCCRFTEMSEAAPAFFRYLVDEWMASEDLQHRHGLRTLRPVFRRVRRDFDRAIRQLVAEGKTVSGSDVYRTFLESVNARIASYESAAPAECFIDVPESEIEDYYHETISGLVGNLFDEEPLSSDDRKRLLRLGALVLRRDTFSDALSGLVFAGFGSKEVFPSLEGYHIDGIIANRLKKKRTDAEKTGRDTIYAKILPFAQREVVDRFLVGIDLELEGGISKYLEAAKRKTVDNVFDGLRGLRKKTKDKILNKSQAQLTLLSSQRVMGLFGSSENTISRGTSMLDILCESLV
jgi:hypothetical protein